VSGEKLDEEFQGQEPLKTADALDGESPGKNSEPLLDGFLVFLGALALKSLHFFIVEAFNNSFGLILVFILGIFAFFLWGWGHIREPKGRQAAQEIYPRANMKVDARRKIQEFSTRDFRSPVQEGGTVWGDWLRDCLH